MLRRLKTSKLLLTGLCLFMGVTLSNSLALAQSACGEIFGASSPLIPLRIMSDGAKEIVNLLGTPEKLTSIDLEQKNRVLETATQDFLESMGFSYKKMLTIDLVKGLKDKGDLHFFYRNVFEITGSRNGGSQARLLYGLQMHPQYKEHKLIIQLDPLYKYKYLSTAHFSPILTKIYIGPHEFMDNLYALEASLRHEVQHFIEQSKLIRGLNTLARFELRSKNPDKSLPYSEFLRADEIETHLRDLRFFTNTNHQVKRDILLAQLGMSPADLQTIKEVRSMSVAYKLEILTRSISSLRASIHEAEAALNAETPWASKSEKPDEMTVAFLLHGNYDGMGISFKGLLKPEEMQDNAKIKSALKSVLTWTKERLNTVEKQIQNIQRHHSATPSN